MSGVRAVNERRVEIPAACEMYGGSGNLVVRREGERLVLDGDHCRNLASL